ncbi:tRNA (adenosine(37)-N6)-threonylcarbamoyltransferase complex ATPase subunit type 1 TsaE [Sulfitobacter sp. S190]|uniref:tRNA (adenosine(37)-N6)-threonylcarbamoyltransferase complex ATPase subunit type 1 TsaE n=1 Tax=Sulfitobacter sp. S190 TaxID=2867022 RepID=UPI0021A8A295|nr:tRNA (adenosine(37)-N6)-threonylcarbamoyltransferase complex ATPase subunit type 1 TsaE [Sulfitobacter sp. S190]UWR22451.1 tRNA (adenosine(37)-N6)-threonylcarbamoyltransferase complex ATPase subunit type 1 TsaE [Sulfitobacter sp. S190]
MPDMSLSLTLDGPDATARCAAWLGARLSAGDTVLLTGDVGAGKTHFARALIQSLLVHHEDVPSPTFTLVQTYDTLRGEIWHSDLYRLSDPTEIEELGLVDAFDDAICLVEWPDRLAGLWPRQALELTLAGAGTPEGRHLQARWQDPKWQKILEGWSA